VVRRRAILFIRKEAIIDIRRNRDDSDHVLIIMIDIDLGDGRMNDLDDRLLSSSKNPKALDL
jgi:hypothetical protein